MFDIDILRMKLEQCYPENKPLAPIEMSKLMDEFCRKRGLVCKFEYLINPDKELNQEFISRINNYYQEVFQDLVAILNYKSRQLIRNKYYKMVYAILEHNNFGIANKNKKRLLKIDYSKFSRIFDVDRKVLASNQKLVNFYDDSRYNWKGDLKYIFDQIEIIVLE